MSFKVFKKLDVFDIFKQFVDDYADKTILDFGGNRGNLISYSNGQIKEENYTCLDLSIQALNIVLDEHPDASVIYWDRYHKTYNPRGSRTKEFPSNNHYDLAFANSVFTHQEIPEILYCIEQLISVSNSVYFTYIDPKNDKVFEGLRNKHKAISLNEEQMNEIRSHKVSYIIDGCRVVHDIVNEPYKEIWTVIDTDYLKSILPTDGFLINNGTTTGFDWMEIKHNKETS
tara:strand:+ start:1266 stop:1952 length:687 start_codon:yes stop_codon:yes gene_type:complete